MSLEVTEIRSDSGDLRTNINVENEFSALKRSAYIQKVFPTVYSALSELELL